MSRIYEIYNSHILHHTKEKLEKKNRKKCIATYNEIAYYNITKIIL